MKRINIVAFMVICFLAAASLGAQSQTGTNFRQEGIASWYGPGFSGRPTASGEIFDPAQLTAAHPSLPFGTILTVTNTFNNKQVRVRVNDRGPFVASRIIDLSQAAAGILDMLVTGTAHVIIETNTNPPPTPPSPGYVQQVNPIVQDFYPPVSQAAVPPAYTPYPYTPTAPVQQQAPAQPVYVPQAAPQPVYTPQPAPQPVYTPQPAPAQQPAYAPQPVYTPQPAPAPAPQPVYTPQPAPAPQPVYAPQPAPVYTPQPAAPVVPAVILGGIPPAGTGKLYRLQIGAYKIPRNAVEAFDKLKAVGLNPAYERLDDMYRVVLASIRPEEMQDVSIKLGAAGFQEVILREER